MTLKSGNKISFYHCSEFVILKNKAICPTIVEIAFLDRVFVSFSD